jgi:hypothetical protein
MVDQNSSPNQPTGGNKPEASHAASEGLSAPSVVKAGEMMLIFALLLIFAVCITVATHLYLRRQRRRRRIEDKAKDKAKRSKSLDSAKDKTFAELIGTPLCEMGESEPRHEMEDAEVHERHTTTNLEHPGDNPVYSPAGTDLEAGTTYFGEMTSRTPVQPEPAMHAVYYARF